jgi:argininosuccinate lyase
MLPAMAGLVGSLRVDVAELRRQAGMGYTLATEVADWLARRGVPFNEAHEIAGKLVGRCLEKGLELEAASDEDLAAVDPRLTPELRAVLNLEAAVAARSAHGGTAPARVREQAAALRGALATQRRWAGDYGGPRT